MFIEQIQVHSSEPWQIILIGGTDFITRAYPILIISSCLLGTLVFVLLLLRYNKKLYNFFEWCDLLNEIPWIVIYLCGDMYIYNNLFNGPDAGQFACQ